LGDNRNRFSLKPDNVIQTEFPFAEPTGLTDADRFEGGFSPLEMVPVRMLNEYVYCPRLAYLEWVQGEFEESHDTIEGHTAHKRVDRKESGKPLAKKKKDDVEENDSENDDEPPKLHSRSVMLSSLKYGMIARLDLVEKVGNQATPVDYKKGKMPDNEWQAWPADIAQICAQAMILRDNGFTVEQGVLYYVASKERVEIQITDALIDATLRKLQEMRLMARHHRIPPPLEDSPKCVGCSLAGICLPDEVLLLKQGAFDPAIQPSETPIRRLIAPRYDAVPLYVKEQGAYISKSGERLVVKKHGQPMGEARLLHTHHISIFGNVQVSTQAVREIIQDNIPICYYTYGGWFYGISTGMGHKNVELRIAQFDTARNPEISLMLAKRFIIGKVKNSRTLLNRNWHEDKPQNITSTDSENANGTNDVTELKSNKTVLKQMNILLNRIDLAKSAGELLGLEGNAAAIYFKHFSKMLKPKGPQGYIVFDFSRRNRRPPKDPVNALLSFAYSLLAKDCLLAAMKVGFDPYLGFYHRPRYGRPALALDLMETFRPLIADSVVITAINTGIVTARDFNITTGGVHLLDRGRRDFIRAYERRMDTLISHPIFGYKINYRRVLEIEARLLSRFLLGELSMVQFPPFTTR